MHITINGADIFFDVVSSQLDADSDTMQAKPTLLMLHGGPGYDHTTLRPHFDRFGDTYQVIYLDHRGCGRSGGAQNTWHLDQWADDVAEFCARLGLVSPIVFGQSFGGMVAMHYAARYPDGPSKLILSSTAARFELAATIAKARDLGGDLAADVAETFFNDPTLAHYALYEQVCLPLYSRAPAAAGGAFRQRAIQKPEVTIHFFRNEMMAMDLRPTLSAITCPTLVLAGAEDPVTPTKCSKDISDAIGENACLEVFENCGHGVHRDDPDASATLMRAFMGAG